MKRFIYLYLMMMLGIVGIAGKLNAESILPAGTFDLQLGGHMDFDNANGDTDFTIKPALGYFVWDCIELGGFCAWDYDGSDHGFGFGAFGEYNFDLGYYFVPYLGFKAGFFFGNLYEDNFLLTEYTAGVKYFISDSVAPFIEIYYDLASEDAFMEDNELENHDFGINIGVRCFF
jgi:hypothetical protein